MEKNILKSMQCGQVPGQVVAQEDTVESLPKPITKKVNKPKLLRTISSMDHDLLKELTNIDAECNPPAETSPDYGLNRLGLENSPENASTDFFRALPQPEDQTIKSSSCIPPSLTPCSTSSFSSFDKDEPVITTGRSEFHDVKALSKSIPKPHLSKRNTCGTMYVSSTMADPDKDATIKCVCGVYRAHVIQSASDTTATQTKFAEYEIFNDIFDAKSGVDLEIESNEKSLPSLDEITSYFRFIFNKAQLESDCIIMSLIYVERLLRETNGGVRPNLDNWKSLLFSCMIMASKVWDDLSMWNVDFSQACPDGVTFSLQRINELELAVLSCLKYNVKVPASEYAKYYFLMRSMLIRSGLAGDEIRSSKPLDMEGAKKLEFLTSSYNVEPIAPASLRRAKSVGIGTEGDSTSPTSPTATKNVKLEQVVNMSKD